MSKNNTLWWIFLLGWIGAGTWWHNCHIKLLCDEPLLPSRVQPAMEEYPLFQLSDGPDFSVRAKGNFSFARSGSEPNLTLVAPQLDSLVAYLKSNPGKTLVVTGHYDTQEHTDKSGANLGKARAEAFKTWLVARGLPESRFTVEGSLKDSLIFNGDSLYNGMEIRFGLPLALGNPSDQELADQQQFNGIFEPLDLYFKTGSSQYIKTKDNETFVNQARAYLKAHGDKTLLLTGHTDNTGTAAGNMALSLRRAEGVKRMLVQRGMPAAQLKVDGKGQEEPKADNASPAGRAVNRRCAIIVQ